jgi:HAD superfamily hydrolase (TIGR01509 family)
MDGTLIDTEPYWMEAELELVSQHGGQWSIEQGLAQVGKGLSETAESLQQVGVEWDTRAIIDWLSAYVHGKMSEHMPWRPGAVELVHSLHAAGIPRALVTMSFRHTAMALSEAISKEIGAVAFDAIVTGEDVTRPKPHPEAYLQAAQLLTVSPLECVAFEDSEHGATSAFTAGAITVGLPLHVDIPRESVHTFWDSLDNKTLDDIRDVFASGRGQ